MIQVLRRHEAHEEFDCPCRPPGRVASELFEDDGGSLAPAIRDRVRDVGAQTDVRRFNRADRSDAEQIADVGDDPVLARLDEPVTVERRHVAFDALELALDDCEQCPQRLALVDVAIAQERGQQEVQPLRHQQAHGVISVSVTPAGLTNSSSAGSCVALAVS